MAITEFNRIGRGAISVTHEDGVFTSSERWQAKTDVVEQSPLFFIGDPLFPARGAVHPNEPRMRLKDFSDGEMSDGSGLSWDFNLEWSTQLADPGTLDGADVNYSEDIYILLRAQRSWSFRTIQKPVARAFASDDGGANFYEQGGNPLLLPVANTVGDPFVPAPTRPVYMPVCSYRRNELAPPAQLLELVGAVNSTAFVLDGLAVAPGIACITNLAIGEKKKDAETNLVFRNIRYEFTIDYDGWDIDVLNRGFYQFAEPQSPSNATPIPTQEKIRIKLPKQDGTDSSTFADSPQLLTVDGRVINTQDPQNVWQSQVHFRRFRHARFLDFTGYTFS